MRLVAFEFWGQRYDVGYARDFSVFDNFIFADFNLREPASVEYLRSCVGEHLLSDATFAFDDGHSVVGLCSLIEVGIRMSGSGDLAYFAKVSGPVSYGPITSHAGAGCTIND